MTPMPDPATPVSRHDDYAPTALPSTGARVLAFVSILIGGLAGGLIGWSLVDLQCSGDCGLAAGGAAVVGALIGSAVVATLALRAMGEWRTVQHRQQLDGRSNHGEHAQHTTEPGPPRC
jgi:predicted lipid-binding transport protein (Tim44 family)